MKIRLYHSIILYFIVSYLNSFVAYNLTLSKGIRPKLFDFGHFILPEISTYLPDIFFFSILFFFVIRWSKEKDLLKMFFLICSLLFFFRLLTFPLTHLPPAYSLDSNCIQPNENGPWIFFTWYSQSTCIDYLFSAHTFHLTIISLITIYYSKNYIEKLLIPLVCVINVILIIAARMHYTSDIIIALILSIILYSSFELYKRNINLEKMLKSKEK
tara:strand:- start:1 stop:642 length:642 start_codon:yes stop_codon:yes gene_type:complete